MSICVECARGFHAVCHVESNCPCVSSPASVGNSEPTEDGGISRKGSKVNSEYDVEDPEAEWRVSSGNSRRGKRDASLKDQQSTGRKRAALLYPLPPKNSPEPCEWQGRERAGGGIYPIKGCIDGTQSHRHHGPSKNTLDNEEGNVHRICTFCHNRWHALNDPVYNPQNPIRYEIQDLMDKEGQPGYTTQSQKDKDK